MFNFTADLKLYQGKAAWHFVSIPSETAENIKARHKQRGVWGSLKVKIKIGESEWKTSIWGDKKNNSFFLPIKNEIRKKEKLGVGDSLNISLSIEGVEIKEDNDLPKELDFLI